MTNTTAEVSDVAIGNVTIVGLKDEQGEYYVGVPQLAALVLEEDSRSQASQTFKRLMGKGFKTNKLKTEFNKNITLGIPLIEFEKLLAKLDRSGNLKAQQLRDDLVGLSLHQSFADAFNDKFEKEERQEWWIAREQSKATRRLLGDAIKDYVTRHPELSDNHKKWLHPNCTDKVYRAVLGKPAVKLKVERNCIGELRDFFSRAELNVVEKHEDYAARLIDKFDTEPQEAVAQAIKFYS